VAVQADVTNKHAYENISLLLTHGFHQHNINNDYINSDPRLDPSVDFRLRLDHVGLRVRAPIRLQLGVLGRLRALCYRPLSPPGDHVFVRAGSYAIDWLALLPPRSLAASTDRWRLATG